MRVRCREGQWGDELVAAAASHENSWPRWRRLIGDVEAALNRLPFAVNHHDPAFSNARRRRPEGEGILFDLHYVDRAPRLRDLALCLGGFQQPWPAQRGRRYWIECYCAALASRGGPVIPPEQAGKELMLHLAAQSCWMDQRSIAQAQVVWQKDPRASRNRGARGSGGPGRSWIG